MAFRKGDTDTYTVKKTQVQRKRIGLDMSDVWLEQRSTSYEGGIAPELEYFLCARDDKDNLYRVRIHRV